MKLPIDKNVLISAIVLGIFGMSGTIIVATTNLLTDERIKKNVVAARLKQIDQILPQQLYNNKLLNDTLVLPKGELSEKYQATIYRARLDGKDIAVIAQTTAQNGYSGPITLLIGMLKNGTVSGVRVLRHKETPGLGDKIELKKSSWILGFSGKSLLNPNVDNWRVMKDGGVFDQFTGATISPRAITQAVRDTLLYFRAHRDTLFAKDPLLSTRNSIEIL